MSNSSSRLVYLTDRAAQQTSELLASFARKKPSEGVVYWFGLESESFAVVTTLIVPNAQTGPGHLRTSVEANAEAVQFISGTPLVYIGQAHSHPGQYVEHSYTDDVETFACFDGVISVVVPRFGRDGLSLKDCGIYRYLGGQFRHIQNIHQHIQILPAVADLRRGEKR